MQNNDAVDAEFEEVKEKSAFDILKEKVEALFATRHTREEWDSVLAEVQDTPLTQKQRNELHSHLVRSPFGCG